MLQQSGCCSDPGVAAILVVAAIPDFAAIAKRTCGATAMQRRSFLATTLAAAAAGFVEPVSTLGAATSPSLGAAGPLSAPAAPLRILILGGTGFIGPHMVRYAVERGHRVTTFTRGRRQPWLFDNVWQRSDCSP
jgi:hypothetical protein